MTSDSHAASKPLPAGYEEAFERETRELLGYRFRVSFAVGIVLYMAFSGLDWFFAPNQWGTFLVMRGVVASLAGLAIWASTTRWGSRNVLPLSFAMLSFASVVLSLMTAMLDGFSSGYFYGNMLVLFLVGLFMPWRPGVTLTFCSLVTCGYFVVNLWAHDLNLDAVLPFFFLIGTCALTFMGSMAIQKSRRTELRQRMELEEAHSQLQELADTKSRFFANVNHELRTPLMLILGPLEQMLAGKSHRDPRPMLESMDMAARRLMKQINTMLDFSKLEDGEAQVSLQSGNVGEVLMKLVRAADAHAEIHALRLESRGLDEVPNSLFDPEKVETIGSNLLGNALKFTEDGGRISVRAGADKKIVWFEVEDTGAGIPTDQINRIFERFHQVTGTRSGKVQGTGLGLSLAREFARLHGGDIKVQSTHGVGTTFRVELPLEPTIREHVIAAPKSQAKRADAPVTDQELGLTQGRISRTQEERNRGRTMFADLEGSSAADFDPEALERVAPEGAPLVLLVEDNDDMRKMMADELASHYRIILARDGEEGLRTAQTRLPELIVSDVMMPKLDGVGMLQRLREHPRTKEIPVILVTARTGTEAVVDGLVKGATDYVTKPFQMAELHARIDAQLRMVQTTQSLDERETRLAALGQRAGDIAHDLRNPLTAINLRAQHLLLHLQDVASDDSEDMLDDVGSIRKALKRASGMVDELVDFVRGNQLELELNSVPVQGLVSELIEQFRDGLAAAGLELQVEVEPPDLTARMDRGRMFRVLANLLQNAQQAMTQAEGACGSRIWLTAAIEDNQVVIRVADNGPGIPAELRDTLFESYATAGKVGGTGLGLAIAHNLVEMHGGRLETETAPPEGGAAFRIYMPRDQSFWQELVDAKD